MHGHNATLEVEYEGPIGELTGMILDFKELKNTINTLVVTRLDHQPINQQYTLGAASNMDDGILKPGDMVGPKTFENPTAENITLWVWKILNDKFDDRIVRIRFWETSDSYAEIKR
jgi:6-pyruvoyl-tetrahydropterin synthase